MVLDFFFPNIKKKTFSPWEQKEISKSINILKNLTKLQFNTEWSIEEGVDYGYTNPGIDRIFTTASLYYDIEFKDKHHFQFIFDRIYSDHEETEIQYSGFYPLGVPKPLTAIEINLFHIKNSRRKDLSTVKLRINKHINLGDKDWSKKFNRSIKIFMERIIEVLNSK